jgi:Trk K+ transport system NAD-binding subunit
MMVSKMAPNLPVSKSLRPVGIVAGGDIGEAVARRLTSKSTAIAIVENDGDDIKHR